MVTTSFIISSLLLLLTPGPTNTLLASCGASYGWRKAAVLPIAEALGYAISITLVLLASSSLSPDSAVFSLLRILLGVWLAYSACKLWNARLEQSAPRIRKGFASVLVATIANSKTVVVGTILIPPNQGVSSALWILTFVSLSVGAGEVWVIAGSCLPSTIRANFSRIAAVVLTSFSAATLAGLAG